MINKFLGLQNTSQPERLPLGALLQADNVQITKDGMIEHRPLETKIIGATSVTSSYGTNDQSALFLVDNGSLFIMEGTGISKLADSLFNTTPVYWCEESSMLVFFVGGGTAGYITAKGSVSLLSSINSAVVGCAFHNSSLVTALLQGSSETFILFSKPYEFDQYYDNESGFFIPYRVTGMQSLNGSLLITTTSNILVYTPDEQLIKLADFGTPLGKTITVYQNTAFIWTNKGLCRFPDFANLTKDTVSVPAGFSCSTNMFEYNGSRYALALTDGNGVKDNGV